MITKICETCAVEFRVKNNRNATARFCSRDCGTPPKVDKICEICGVGFQVIPSRASSAKFCSYQCGGVRSAERINQSGVKPWSRGNIYRQGLRPTNAYPKGHQPWHTGTTGIHLSPGSEFKKGGTSPSRNLIGAETVRIDGHQRPRMWVKISQPNKWRQRAVVIWESNHGERPPGVVIHHINHNTLDDTPSNLVAVSRSGHINLHRGDLK